MYKKYQLLVERLQRPFYILTTLLILTLSIIAAKRLFPHENQQALNSGNQLQVKCSANDLQVVSISTTKAKVKCIGNKTPSRTSTNEPQPSSPTYTNQPEPPAANLTATVPTLLPPSGNQGIWISAAELAHLSKSKLSGKRKNRAKGLRNRTIILLQNPDKELAKTILVMQSTHPTICACHKADKQ